MRRLGVDHGTVRIGIAVSDVLGIVARPLTIIKHTNRQRDAEAIAALAVEHEVGEIIIGLPTSGNHEIGSQARIVQRFGNALAEQARCPVIYWDESYSTSTAQAARHARGVRRKKRTALIDAEAAAVILQSYLDAHAK